jgi:hypothetical protein
MGTVGLHDIVTLPNFTKFNAGDSMTEIMELIREPPRERKPIED